MATNPKNLKNMGELKSVGKDAEQTNPTPRRVALTPARRREIGREVITEWRETLDILERHDQGKSTADDPTK